ncbi:MAG: AI-2E family transporter [Methylacidiphilales bacterium]|nr:AI-2E family transporter [Candidatus Methylacidiphilales bacterium]
MNRALVSGPIVWLGIIITTCLLLVLFQTALWLVIPVLLAVVAYYLLSPLVNMAMARGLTRARSVLIVTILLTLFLIMIGLILAPKISSMIHNGPGKIKEYSETAVGLFNNAQQTLTKYFPFLHHAPPPAQSVGVVGVNLSTATPESDLGHEVSDLTDKYSGDIALELLHWIPSLLLIPYLTYFFLLDGPRFKRFLVQAIPNAFFEKTLYLFYRVDDQLRRYFQGLLALTALDAMCLGVGLWLLGIDNPFLLAAIAAVMAWLPYLGSICGCLLIVLIAAHDFPGPHWLPYEVVGLFVAVRLLDDFVFLPLTVGRSMEMHPLVTVLMILLGGAVAGISGLLLVMPVLGVVMVIGQIVGELAMDARIIARYRHACELRRRRARADLTHER